MRYITRKQKNMYKKLLTNIDKYDIIYIASETKPTGSMVEFDDYTIYYINAHEHNGDTFDIVANVLYNEAEVWNKINTVAIVNAHLLPIWAIRELEKIQVGIDYYALFSNRTGDIYSTAYYLKKMKEDNNG